MGLGAHWRWCPEVVGLSAHITGRQAEQAESLADSVGANEPGAANHLYVAGALLRERALMLAARWQEHNEPPRRDGKK